MKKKSHRKKIVIAVLIVIVAVFTSVSIIGSKTKRGIAKEDGVESVSSEYVPSLDSDGDGLADWEELLNGTDPNNSDSDGDGNRDTKAVTTASKSTSNNTTGFPFRPESMTGEVGLSLFTKYLSAAKQGSTLPDAELQNFALQTTNKVSNYDRAFTSKDFRIIPDTSSESDKSYLNAIAAIFVATEVSPSDNELMILLEFAKDSESVELAELSTYAERYFAISRSLEETAVPKNFVQTHVSLTQFVYNTGLDLARIAKMQDFDPIVFLVSIQNYSGNSAGINARLNDLISYSAKSGLGFEANELFAKLVNIMKSQ